MASPRPHALAPSPNRSTSNETMERGAYKAQRRLDALRLLPVLGVLAFLLPLLAAGSLPGGGTAQVGIYLFAAWAGLIALAGWLSRRAVQDRARDRVQGLRNVPNSEAEGGR